MKAMFMFTLISTLLFLCCKIYHSSDNYNAFASDWEQICSLLLQTDQNLNYDITYWIRSLQLEHYTFVEIGERFYALFVEIHDPSSVMKIVDNFYVTELCFGFCSCFILHFGYLSAAVITKLSKSNGAFTQVMVCDNTSAQIHQRLYNIYSLSTEIHTCNYSMNMANQSFRRTEGFPTCFQSLLSSSLYTICNVYEIARCSALTINRIYSVKCLTNCHEGQLFCKDTGLRTFKLLVVVSSWLQWPHLMCNSNYEKGQLVAVTLFYNQVISAIPPKKCFFIFLSTSGTMAAVRLNKLYFSLIDSIEKDTCIYAFKELINNRQEINEVYNDFKVSREDWKHMKLLHRRLLQNIDHKCYQNVDYNIQGGESNYRRYARYIAPAMSEGKSENESEDEDQDDDYYEVSDEKADKNSEEDEQENENEEEEEEEDNECGNQKHGQWIRMERSNRIGLHHPSKEQKKYLKKRTVRIQSVSKECNHEPTEELQYYDYEASGIDAPFGNMHRLQIGCLAILTATCLLFTFII